MDSARQATISKLSERLVDVTTVRSGDSHWLIAERVLALNGKEPSAATISSVAQLIVEETKSGTLRNGQSLLCEVLAVRRRSAVLKREMDQYARTLLKQERQRQHTQWRRLQTGDFAASIHQAANSSVSGI